MSDAVGQAASPAAPRFGFNNFDLLRLLAAVQVLVFHSARHLELELPEWMNVFERFPGVPVFFVISGYLVSASYERSGNLTLYLQNRFLRIFPGLWACLAATVVVASAFGFNFLRPSALTWFVAQMVGLIYTPGFLDSFGFGSYNGSLWTIPVELQFYCVVPFVYLLAHRTRWRNLVFVLLFLAFVAIVLFTNYDISRSDQSTATKVFGYTFVPHFYMFLAGLLLQRAGAYRSAWIFNKGPLWVATYLSFSFLAPETVATKIALSLVMAVCTVSMAYTLPGVADKLLHRNDISYGVYIYHGLLLNVLVSLHWLHRIEYLLIVLAGACTLGYLSWVFVERPFLRKKKHTLKATEEIASPALAPPGEVLLGNLQPPQN
jgi:peptidoglycan/LPS O-acetylase OafA/YrhL